MKIDYSEGLHITRVPSCVPGEDMARITWTSYSPHPVRHVLYVPWHVLAHALTQ